MLHYFGWRLKVMYYFHFHSSVSCRTYFLTEYLDNSDVLWMSLKGKSKSYCPEVDSVAI